MNSRQKTIEKYGTINDQCIWADQSKHMVNFRLPAKLVGHPDYSFVIPFIPGQPKVKLIFMNRDLVEPFEKAISNILVAGIVGGLREFGGCFNIRASRGSNNLSAHAWGLAIDINMTGNSLGNTPKMDKVMVACFEDAGFYWGGRYKRPDGMHLSIADFDKPSE